MATLRVVLATVALAALAAPCIAFFAPHVVEPESMTLLRSYGGSALYGLNAKGYDSPILVANLTGSTRYEMGYAYGRLLAAETVEDFELLFDTVLPSRVLQIMLTGFLSWEFDMHLRPNMPEEYLEELRGLDDGGRDAGHPRAGDYARLGIALANVATGDVTNDITYLIENQFCDDVDAFIPGLCTVASAPTRAGLVAEFAKRTARLFDRHCSLWGAWGSRTEGGQLFSGRNLDWLADSGISRNKLVTVFHPPEEGRHSHATFAFAGLYGALAGLSSQGITTHEAGLDSKLETLDGFPWVLRLRYVMERAATLPEAMALWNGTQNTLGINHGIGSARDGALLALETRAGYTAVFGAGDGREAANEHGMPMEEAVWRTNHAYDPEIIRTGLGINPHPGDSLTRYTLIHDTIDGYARAGRVMGPMEAVNVTAVPGDKGGSSRGSFVDCADAAKGENILSVAFQPAAQTAFVAFETGHGASHVPACCGSYVHLQLGQFFAEPFVA